MKPADVFLAVLVAVIWGLAFVASRLALDELSPALMTAMRQPRCTPNIFNAARARRSASSWLS